MKKRVREISDREKYENLIDVLDDDEDIIRIKEFVEG